MKKLLSILMLLVAIVTGASADPVTVFNAGDSFWSAKTKANLATDVTNGNVSWYATAEKAEISSGNKTIGGVQWSARLKFGGASTFKSNSNKHLVLGITVESAGTMKVYFISGKANDTRSVYISTAPTTTNRDPETVIGSASDDGNNGNVASANITAAGTYYIWSDNNIGVYGVTFEASAPSGPSLSVAPAEANPFTYVVGNGPSDAQAFTVSLANSTKAVSATLSGTNYEMSKSENGTYSSDAITDLANEDVVYVRLKAGLEKGTGYDGTLTFANADVTANVVVNLSGSVTGQTYAVTYNLNGGNGTAPTQAAQEKDAKFSLATAPTKDFSTFVGWLCNVDGQTYDAGDEYTMTAEATTFTAQWSAPTYSSTLDFGANAATAPTIATFLADGNMISSGLTNNSAWENSATKPGFVGFKIKDSNASVKFLAQAGKHVTITLGSVGASFTLKKNGTSATVPANKGDFYQTVIAFDAEEDVIVEINTTSNSTITLNKIAIEDALASTPVTVGETGFATIGLPYATTIPENVTAYSVSATSETAVTLSSAIAAGTTIPANKGFIIVANPGNYTFNQFANGTWQGDITNKLEATGASAKVAAAAGEFYYFAIINADKKKVGFKKCAANASLAANKAYLPGALVPSGSNSLEISFDGETAINGIAESEANAEAPVKVVKNGQLYIGNYNVAGQLVK